MREDRNGTPLEFTLYTNAGNQMREKICAILKQDWESLGMKVHFKALDFGLLVEKLDGTFDWDAMLMGFTGSVEPHNGANLLRSSGNLHLWHPNQTDAGDRVGGGDRSPARHSARARSTPTGGAPRTGASRRSSPSSSR